MMKFRTRKEAEKYLAEIQHEYDARKNSEVFEFDDGKEDFYFISEGEKLEYDDDLERKVVREINMFDYKCFEEF